MENQKVITTPKLNPLKAIYRFTKYGYQFIQKSCQDLGSDLFKIKIAGLTIVCFTGEEAARAFYNESNVVRKGAVPEPVKSTLTGKGAIHTTDGAKHRRRKQLFVSLMGEENVAQLAERFGEALGQQLAKQQNETFTFFKLAQQALTIAVCQWAGVPLQPSETEEKAKDFIAMVDAFGAIGLRNWRGRMARYRIEKWIEGSIADVRSYRFVPPEQSALALAARYRDEQGKRLSLSIAAVELINILRPTVAISWYIVFAATALHQHPQLRAKFAANQAHFRRRFVDEVRRFYPFAPFMGARARKDFNWKGHEVKKAALVLLDMYGTNHDERLWPNPFTFDPDRFLQRPIKPFDFLAQGGGNIHEGHRCPGEKITIALVEQAIQFFINEKRLQVPAQDLGFSLSRMPTLPRSKFKLMLLAR